MKFQLITKTFDDGETIYRIRIKQFCIWTHLYWDFWHYEWENGVVVVDVDLETERINKQRVSTSSDFNRIIELKTREDAMTLINRLVEDERASLKQTKKKKRKYQVTKEIIKIEL